MSRTTFEAFENVMRRPAATTPTGPPPSLGAARTRPASGARNESGISLRIMPAIAFLLRVVRTWSTNVGNPHGYDSPGWTRTKKPDSGRSRTHAAARDAAGHFRLISTGNVRSEPDSSGRPRTAPDSPKWGERGQNVVSGSLAGQQTADRFHCDPCNCGAVGEPAERALPHRTGELVRHRSHHPGTARR